MLHFRLPSISASKATLFVSLLSLSGFAVASGQTSQHKPLPTEELEKYDNPPALLSGGTVSRRGMISRFNAFTSFQVNVDATGHNITGDAANEPSISVDPTNGNRMTIGWRQFNSVTSNFRQAGWAYTTNGGASWTFPGVLENNVFRSDPVLDYDASGDFFYLSLLETFLDNMWRSLDGGMSWANLAPAKGGDKQWFTIDNDEQHWTRIPISVLEHQREQFWRAAIHAARPTADSPGWTRSTFPTLPPGARRTWIQTAPSLSAESTLGRASFGASVRAMPRTRPRPRALTKARRSTWAAT